MVVPPMLRLIQEQLRVLRDRLAAVQQENKALRAELARRPRRPPASVDMRALRRRVTFHCHPDRGGNARFMQDVNVLFDCFGGET